MKEIVINKKVVKKSGLSVGQLFYLFYCNFSNSLEEIEDLRTKHFLISQPIKDKPPFITDKGVALLTELLVDTKEEEMDRITELVPKLQELFPKGKKQGTNYYWRGNKKEIEVKLRIFFKKYGEYPDDKIIQATENYIKSYKDDMRFMQLLKYFILKNIRKEGETIEQSELLTYIENIDNNDINSEFLEVSRLI